MPNLEPLYKILYDLCMTPNGRLFVLGTVLTAGSAYYVFDKHFEDEVFAYVVLGIGSLFVLVSMVMATVAKILTSREKLTLAEMDKEIRETRMEHGEKDKTIYKLDE